uniref:Putative secreted protein n=1 Tax=Ixodes scapularis TaxID=6945 RepID=A0A4D5REX6_IXOSC
MIARQRHQPGRLQFVVLCLLTFYENLACQEPVKRWQVVFQNCSATPTALVGCLSSKQTSIEFRHNTSRQNRIQHKVSSFVQHEYIYFAKKICSKSRFCCSETLSWLLQNPLLLLQNTILVAPKATFVAPKHSFGCSKRCSKMA